MHSFFGILRPRQWIKNCIVLAGLAFAIPDASQSVDIATAAWRSFAAMVLFCLASSVIYIINDINDADEDRAHPYKRTRPIASGLLSTRTAAIEGAALAAAVAAGAYALGNLRFSLCLGAYFVLQTAYTFALKKMALVDVFAIALGFVMRVYAGTVAAGVRASSWLVLCTFAVALFIALCKRYDERMLLGADAAKHRKALAQYDPDFLGHSITATAALAIICYAIYTLSYATVQKFGHERLVATVPFVVFGIYRYAYLVFCKGKGGRPERLVTTDVPTIINFVLYAVTAVLALSIKC